MENISEAELNRRLYNIYNHINYRCYNINCDSYERYGGRGIINEFKDFKEFKDAMLNSFISHVKKYGYNNTTIDRIDNNGNYVADNLKWSTRKEQASNRCTTHYIKIYSILNNEYYISNSLKSLYERLHIAWDSVKRYIDTEKNIKNFIISTCDISEYTPEDLDKEIKRFYTSKIPIEVYEITKDNSINKVYNLKEYCRLHGIDPSAAYKCANGKRKSVGGCTIKKIIEYV